MTKGAVRQLFLLEMADGSDTMKRGHRMMMEEGRAHMTGHRMNVATVACVIVVEPNAFRGNYLQAA